MKSRPCPRRGWGSIVDFLVIVVIAILRLGHKSPTSHPRTESPASSAHHRRSSTYLVAIKRPRTLSSAKVEIGGIFVSHRSMVMNAAVSTTLTMPFVHS